MYTIILFFSFYYKVVFGNHWTLWPLNVFLFPRFSDRSFLHAQGIHSASCWEGWWLNPSLSISLSWRELFDIISYLFPRGNPHPITSCYELIKFWLPCLKENNCGVTSQEFQSFLVIWLKPVLQLIFTVTLPFAKTLICPPQCVLFLVCLLYHFWTKISISEPVSWKI